MEHYTTSRISYIVMGFVMCLVGSAQALSVSPDGGFFLDTVQATLSANSGNKVVYTLDGSDPISNGAQSTGPFTIDQLTSAPSPLALNTETALWGMYLPQSTLKARILRAAEIAPNGSVVSTLTRTFFVGYDKDYYSLPIFSIVTEDKYLQDYDIGMLIKGATYYDDLASDGGNPLNPFRPANWNNNDLRWPEHHELFVNGTLLMDDAAILYTSGRWSAALPKKSLKIKYDKDIGKGSTKYPLFGSMSIKKYDKLWFRQGAQDFNGLQLRDCAIGEIAQGMDVEIEQCRQVLVFLNGEYYGIMNLHEVIDDKFIAEKYDIDNKDIVILSQDGLIDEGKDGDNQPYFDLRAWMKSNNLGDAQNYQFFKSQVNVDSLLDYYTIQIFFNNVDFPADHRFWRNKNPASQVAGTPIDGRWQFHPKDRDQTMGLYSHISATDNTLQKFLSKDTSDWGTLFFIKAMESPEFRQQFKQRSEELLNTQFDVNRMNHIIDSIAVKKRPELSKEFSRWQKPTSSWEQQLLNLKNWLAIRHNYYRTAILDLPPTIPLNSPITNTTTPSNPPELINSTNSTDSNNEAEQSQCYTSIDLPPSCDGGTISSDIMIGGCRVLTCTSSLGETSIKACPKSTYFDMWPVSTTGTGLAICLGPVCLNSQNGYARSPDYPICTSTQTPTEPEPNSTKSPTTDSYSASLRIGDWYPKGLNVVLLCEASGFSPSTYDFYFGDGSKLLNYGSDNVYKTYSGVGSYAASCVARNNDVSASATLQVNV